MSKLFGASCFVAMTALLTATDANAGQCAMVLPQHTVLNHEAKTLPHDGGFIVAETGTQPTANKPNGHLLPRVTADGKKQATVKPTTIAPGLLVYSPVNAKKHFDIVFEKASVAKATGFKPTTSVLTAPQITAVENDTINGRRATSISVTAALSKPAPEGAIAVVVYGIDKDGNATPHAWGPVVTGSKSVVLLRSSGRCEHLAQGTVASKTGDSVALAFVGSDGRVSARSEMIKVRQGKLAANLSPSD